MSGPLLGALLGLGASGGVVLAIARLPRFRSPSLDDRLSPYLRDTAGPSRLLHGSAGVLPFPVLDQIFGPSLREVASVLDRWLGGAESVRRRLVHAGGRLSLEQFRLEQAIWSAVGLALSALVVVVHLLTGAGPSTPGLLALAVLSTAGGALARDWWLGREVSKRQAAIQAEFPTIAELLALAVAAGEGPVGALERVTRLSGGELSRELARALADAKAGASLVVALQGVATRTALPSLARFTDGLAVAIERGTPLAEVMRAQAVDAREAAKRALLEAGGKKEIAMLVPVVFLVLPVVVVFALYPGFVQFTVISR